ncbi:MAG TPA: hypothetical protein VHB70_12790, partial [Parafilimonas sp.]|nr:hypothetical protein [Parafilimonas sp.]
MRKLFIFLLLISFFDSFSQTKAISINDKYFILGTLDDYLGRGFYSSIADHVDYYYPGEEPLVKYIESLLKADKIKYK